MAEDILIVAPNWVGDMVMTEPLVAALARHWPERAIDILAPEPVLEVARRMPGLRAGIPLPFSPHRLELGQRRALGHALRGCYADAYVLPGSFISALVPAFAHISKRHGYVREFRYGLINRIVRMPKGTERRTAEAYQGLAGETRAPRPRLIVDEGNRSRLLISLGLRGGDFVALMPGAEGGPAKRWPAPAFAELARAILADGLAVVILGGSNDAETTATVAAAAPGAINLGGQTGLGDAIDLIAAAREAVANDTGLMHIAAAVGTPVVGIYGSTSPDDTPPLADAAAIVTHRLACSPCHARICPLGHTNCLAEIAPAEILAAIGRLRSRQQAPS